MTAHAGAAPVAARPYVNPYAAGVALGLVLLTTFAVMGHGIGASGAFASAVAAAAPGRAAVNEYFRPWVANGQDPLVSWIVLEVAGIFAGGFLSAWMAKRLTRTVERGPRLARGQRFAYAALGGLLMGFASRLARGCSSGQALTGGALLSVGSWVFMIAIFVAGYAAAPLFRKEWA
jgi:uncharacterized membrane protein YedE/YeeE